jgi:hypothetical protein
MRSCFLVRTVTFASALMFWMIFMASQAFADTYYPTVWPNRLRIAGGNEAVVEGSTSSLTFIVWNISTDSTYTLNLSLNPTVGATTGDDTDWAKFTGWGPSPSSCWAKTVLAPDATCVLIANFSTDTTRDTNEGPPDTGTTPFTVTVNI